MIFRTEITTVEALVSDYFGNSKKCGRNKSWLLTRMSSRKQPHGKTMEGGRLLEQNVLQRRVSKLFRK